MKAYVIKKGKRYLTTNLNDYSKDYPVLFKSIQNAENEVMPTEGEKIIKVDFKITESKEIITKAMKHKINTYPRNH
jgi:hypothetical protein